jgi:hypothetical protein
MVTALRARPHLDGDRIDLAWRNPPASDFAPGPPFAGIRIVRRQRQYARSETDGDVIYDGAIISAFADPGLEPLTGYYYTVYAFDASAPAHSAYNPTAPYNDGQSAQAVALAGGKYALADRLYGLLPAAYQRDDTPLGPGDLSGVEPEVIVALGLLPPTLARRGQLYRFLQGAAPFDLLRSLAEGLRQVQDADLSRPEFLPLLARWLGWEPDRSLPVFSKRNEVKFAPHLLRAVGTIPSVRALATRYTGWYPQVAEFAQHIARANVPPRLNVSAMVADGAAWRGWDDAAPLLGFGIGNNDAVGGGVLPAILVSSTIQPFALRPDVRLAVTADDRIPVTVLFRPGDFVNIAAATALEVVAVLNRALPEVTATATGLGGIELRSHIVGPDSHLVVEQLATSLVTLEASPRGRLSVFAEAAVPAPVRLRLFYETSDPETPRLMREAVQALDGEIPARGLLPDERPLAILPAGPLLGFGPENREKQGTEDGPAILVSSSPGPYAVPSETELAFRIDGGPLRGIRIRGTEFAGSQPVPVRLMSAGEIAAIVEATDLGLVADGSRNDGKLELRSSSVGPSARLSVEPHLLPAPVPAPAPTPAAPGRRVRYKSFRGGTWGESIPLTPFGESEEGEPAAVQMADGRIFVAWVADPAAASAQIFFRLGTPRTPQPARLFGRSHAPFSIRPGSQLLFRGRWPAAEGFEFAASDFLNPQAATIAEVVTALNARLTRVVANAQPDFTLRLQTVDTGGDVLLQLDVGHSSAAEALGFEAANAEASGDWGDTIDWLPPQPVPAPLGRHADLSAIVDGAGLLFLFWSLHVGPAWTVVSTRFNGVAWTPLETLASSDGGDREPCAVLDGTGRLWLFWAQRGGVGTIEDVWTLRYRVLALGVWGPETTLTTALVSPARSADREPGPVRLASGLLRVFFRSDRAGGADLWSLTINPTTSVVTAPILVMLDPAADHAPAPIFSGGRLVLLHRTDRSLPNARVGTRPLPAVDNRVTSPRSTAKAPSGPLRSVRLPDTGSVERFAGSTAVVLGDAARIARRLTFDDLLAYTPQRPRQVYQHPELGDPREDTRDPLLAVWPYERFTRGTIGLFLGQTLPSGPLAQAARERLQSVLDRYLPINVRAVMVLAPRVDIEIVFPGDDAPQDSFLDRYPEIENYDGLADDAAAALPAWVVLRSNTLGDVSVDFANLVTLTRRTFFLPPS